MRSFNRTVLIGNVGGDAVLRYTQTGKAVVNLNLATHSRRKNEEDVTTWHRVVLWDRLAELAHQYVKKGQALYVEGPITHRDWVDKKGVSRSSAEIIGREMIFLDQSSTRPTGSQEYPRAEQAQDGEELNELVEDLPV